jgi:hypothetical protein
MFFPHRLRLRATALSFFLKSAVETKRDEVSIHPGAAKALVAESTPHNPSTTLHNPSTIPHNPSTAPHNPSTLNTRLLHHEVCARCQ